MLRTAARRSLQLFLLAAVVAFGLLPTALSQNSSALSTVVLLSCNSPPCPAVVSPNTPINLTVTYIPSQSTNVWLSNVTLTFTNITGIPEFLSVLSFTVPAGSSSMQLPPIMASAVSAEHNNGTFSISTNWILLISLAYSENRVHDGVLVGAGTFDGPSIVVTSSTGTSTGPSTGTSTASARPPGRTLVIGSSSIRNWMSTGSSLYQAIPGVILAMFWLNPILA
ncbi:hypothetical protein BASA50_003083 [Batrachochytrium salamandrivorans]|uniref:Uncharacterized protein n=1 Tax=Batrachochytrium salamandrivorans TaxID=1357716 RepID=A0ABQ8FJJ7_9FUNG|nr:hypothetical protein BASA60_011218 [Batrachochytrium salamandrivorans]KAH6568765.1 hypothetical protein BASA62_005264 [Batrachochytrium salamandrivorans]KAH6599386.1 hypothetical protein BASA50_003083 [Batrachochytrium salamandrivorans]KAH6602624.1 hypothetical protein BASA61_000957 [Batrachochytrium salamandrivorans]KAH9251975.1 hypothetical protein BASA81_010179 [Batrachochytrium salamandrivorans]